MLTRVSALVAASLLLAPSGFAKDKTKSTLPAYVLRAQTVVVMIDPEAGVSVQDPRANEVAQHDVEAALLKWGKYETRLTSQGVDLIIVVRKGHGKMVDATVSDPRQNNRIGGIGAADTSASIGAQHGPGAGTPGQADAGGMPRMEVGGTDDSFLVFEGGGDNPLDNVPAWRYTSKDALSSPGVPAVAEFKKAVEAAEKAAQKNP